MLGTYVLIQFDFIASPRITGMFFPRGISQPDSFKLLLLIFLQCEKEEGLRIRIHISDWSVHGDTKHSKKISNDQELIQSDPTSCPQNQKRNI